MSVFVGILLQMEDGQMVENQTDERHEDKVEFPAPVIESIGPDDAGQKGQVAVVTGASSGIGLAISQTLLRLGYRVYGVARGIASCSFQHPEFIKKPCDVTDIRGLEQTVAEIQSEIRSRRSPENHADGAMSVLVNCAGVGLFGPHEQLKPTEIARLVQTNLQAPLILTGLWLRDLKKHAGYVINISSVTAKKSSTHGCAYGATKAGLTHFGVSLFDEVRKTGVKVVTIHPDMTDTAFYDQADFTVGADDDTYITAQCVADAVETILSQRVETVIQEMTVRPQRVGVRRKK